MKPENEKSHTIFSQKIKIQLYFILFINIYCVFGGFEMEILFLRLFVIQSPTEKCVWQRQRQHHWINLVFLAKI